MIELQDVTIFVRQIANGSLTISAVFVIAIFGIYVWNNWPYRRENVAVRAAVAIVILMFGHLIRSFSSWMEFIWMDMRWDVSLWLVQSWSWFIISAGLVLLGKALMLLNFSPWKSRKLLTIVMLATSIAFPIAIGLATGSLTTAHHHLRSTAQTLP